MPTNDEVKQAMRERIGTASQQLKVEPLHYVRGGAAVDVKFVDGWTTNWYAGMYVMAVQTWGGPHDSGVDKWNRATPEERALVTQAILTRKALPLALEHPQFLFEISGCSRSAFDQIARARIGVTFSSMGARDNPHANLEIVTPPRTYDSLSSFSALQSGVGEGKMAYVDLLEDGRSWQDARAILPMAMMHRFSMSINFASLSTLLSKRLQFCEQYDTVTVAWRLKQEIGRHYAMLAEALRPGCDFARRCTYHEQDSLGELFGSLFRGCGRWPDPAPYYEFNESSTDKDDVEAWIGEKVIEGEAPMNWDKAIRQDSHWFSKEIAVG